MTEPDEHGLTVLPFWAGERRPGWYAHAKASIEGLSVATSSLEILRAGMEAVAYRVALVFDKLAGLLQDDIQIVAGVGALRNSPVWLQIVTDVLGRNCAKGSALALMEEFGLGNWTIIRAMSPFPGFGMTGGICGGVTGSLIALGLFFGSDDPEDYDGDSIFYQELGPKVDSSPPSAYKICPVIKSDAADAR
jgi:hypothetical protein